jgi:hypothetical protein
MQDEIVAGAMFGDLGFSVPLNDNGSSARQIFIPRRAKLRANAHTTVSAVGVLEHHAPHAHLLDEYLESQLAANPLGRELSDLLQRSADLASEFVACNPHVNDTVVRVRLIHNPFAAVPMRLPTPFSGPHDVHLWPRLE